jgi:poly(hydroxyalkanoate) depolymerase family esterase
MPSLIKLCVVTAVTAPLVACSGGQGDDAMGVESGRLETVASFGPNPGKLRMLRYVPAKLSPNAPLVVAMHGCTQQAADYVKVGWNALADAYHFVVVYPEQPSSNNPVNCFDWFGQYNNPSNKDNITRGKGENESVKEMVDQTKADFSIDPKRVFVSGFSAGAAFVSVMLAAWPDVFSAGAYAAGIPYDCPSTANGDVFNCMSPGKSLSPSDWGDRVRRAFPGYSGPYPRVSIWQGTSDTTVATQNQQELIKQWTNVLGLSLTPTASDTVAGYPHDVYADGAGNVLVESYRITGMAHGVAVDPAGGCGTAGAYVIDKKICQVLYTARFFGIADASPPPPPASDAGVDSSTAPDAADAAIADTSPPPPPPPGGAWTETFPAAGFDHAGWSTTGFAPDTRDHTGIGGSDSLHARVAPSFGRARAIATVPVHVGGGAKLSYVRELDLRGANLGASARWSVIVRDGGVDTTIDARAVTFGSAIESTWTTRDALDLSAFAGKDVVLVFVVDATDTWSIVSHAEAWIDDVHIE